MKKIIFTTMITISMMMVSCGGNTTETVVESADTTVVDSTEVCTDSVSVDTLQIVK